MDERDIEIAKLIVGETEIQVEVPKNVYDLVSLYANSTEIISIYSTYGNYIESMLRAMLPDDIKPSTSKQVRFVRSIADTLNLEVSDEVLRNSTAASKFINDNIVAFENKKSEEKAEQLNKPEYIKARVKKAILIYASKTKPYHKYINASILKDKGLSIDEIAELMDVQPKTVESYLKKHTEIESYDKEEDKLKYIIASEIYENEGYANEVIEGITAFVMENKLHLADWFPLKK
ncbi:hypothetical protein [Dickeya oryzae]